MVVMYTLYVNVCTTSKTSYDYGTTLRTATASYDIPGTRYVRTVVFPHLPFPADDPLDGVRVDAAGDDDRGDPARHGPSRRANLRACTAAAPAATPGQKTK